MFVLNRKQILNPEMSNYIKEHTNKWIKNLKEKYSNKSPYIKVSDLVKHEEPNMPNNFLLIPFVSLISFLAGYNFCKSIS